MYESEWKLVENAAGVPPSDSVTRPRTAASSRGNVSPVTGALTVTATWRSGAVSIVRRTPASAMEEAYMVSATSVVVASRMDPKAANSRSGSLNARLTTNGPPHPTPNIRSSGGLGRASPRARARCQR
ncbi:hypothetical protein ACFSTC_43205 [Nonomuraea ferruginea]